MTNPLLGDLFRSKTRLFPKNLLLLFPFVMMVLFDLLFGLQLDGVSQSNWALIVRLQGLFAGGLFIAILPFVRYRFQAITFEKYYIFLSIIAIFLFLTSLIGKCLCE